ncbi:MAG: hypothetical protein OXE94_09920 [Aestuariivita sp.]|nr:hypothetical protein [Aestuariivita sp.]MCY4203392.1 hypothetical protein [Aestuariivita sp.]
MSSENSTSKLPKVTKDRPEANADTKAASLAHTESAKLSEAEQAITVSAESNGEDEEQLPKSNVDETSSSSDDDGIDEAVAAPTLVAAQGSTSETDHTETKVTPNASQVGFRAVVLAAILGGLVSGGATLTLGHYGILFPPKADDGVAVISALNEDLASLRDQLEAVVARIDNMPPLDSFSEAKRQVSGNTAAIKELQTLKGTLEEVVANAERAASVSQTNLISPEIFEEALQNLRDQLDRQGAELAVLLSDAERREAEAAESVRRATAVARATQLIESLMAGRSIASELDSLRELEVSIPDDLAFKVEGVDLLADLQRDFPSLAREVLTTARTNDGNMGVMAFLRQQFEVRSLTPRDGDTANAILSRAEAALADGNLAAALAELEQLPAAARVPLDDWIERAQDRETALLSANGLLEQLIRNNEGI